MRMNAKTETPTQVSILVGNGLSVAFNPDLNLRALTEEVMKRIERADGGDAVIAMKRLAKHALPHGAESEDDFEVLVGAFGVETSNLSTLHELASLTSPENTELAEAIEMVRDFSEQVRFNGISHVLEVICERTHAAKAKTEQLNALITAILDGFDGRVSFGNLNYDTLLLAELLRIRRERGESVADLANGSAKVTVTVGSSKEKEVQELRRNVADFPPQHRIRVLHLHGSLTYWNVPAKDQYVKIKKEDLQDCGQWEAVRDQTTEARPVVVLANPRDKATHVTDYPFTVAYEAYKDSLRESDFWLIIGYSFRDPHVNRILQREFLRKDRSPRVLVVTHGRTPTRQHIEDAFGWGAEDPESSEWLTINRDGANGLEKRDDWKKFVPDSD